MGRRSKIEDQDLVDRIVENIKSGAIFEDAARDAGISKQSFFSWRNRGEQQAALDEEHRDPEEAIYLDFFNRVKRSDSSAVVSANKSIKKAWMGEHLKKETIIEHPDGSKTTTREYHKPDWHAGAWFLERRRNDDFGRREIIKHAGDSNEPVIVKIMDAEMLAAEWLNYKPDDDTENNNET